MADGVTVIVAVLIALVAFVAVNDAILPVPLVTSPIVASLFAQLYTVPATDPLNGIAATVAVLHTVALVIAATSGVGLTVIVNICVLPEQLLADGVTDIVAVLTALVAFVAVNDAMLPEPLAARPIDGSLLVQP